MKNSKLDELLEDVFHNAQMKKSLLSFVIAGGGADLFRIFQIPGASKVMVDARMLYHPTSFEAFLEKGPPETFVSQMMSDELVLKLSQVSSADVCLAVTSALKTNRERKGADQMYYSIALKGQIVLQKHLKIEGKNRLDQDRWVSMSVLTGLNTVLNALP